MDIEADLHGQLRAAAEAIEGADALLIGAGAGMGVDSGLPDFRGPEGFWKAYPAFFGRQFSDLSTPHWFRSDPALAWGFFGHRLKLYRSATPHAGFHILRRWAERAPAGYFVFTSNVDGQFQKAGFPGERIVEQHGSVHYLQCTRECGIGIWPANDIEIEVDEATVRAVSSIPVCPRCESVARPNILMFGDLEFDRERRRDQTSRYNSWLRAVGRRRLVAIELGAGLAIPTIRDECEERGLYLIRINPREAEVLGDGISLPIGALDAAQRIDSVLKNSS